MKKALVTGANGFIGSWLCKELSSNRVEVYAVVKSEDSNTDEIVGLPGLTIIYCNLSQISLLPQKLYDCEIDVFYHLAWVGSSGALRDKYTVQLDNVKYACDAVNACHALNCRRFIFASSIMEYECIKAVQADAPINKGHIYSAAKIAGNYMTRILSENFTIEYISAIISNTYGPGENSPRLINTTIRKLLKGQKASFTAGEQLYDFIYVTDAVKAMYLIGLHGHPYKNYYIGNLSQKPLKMFLYEIYNCVASKSKPGLGEIPFEGVSLTYEEFDIYALKRDTGFEPQVSFNEGIQQTIKWLRRECYN